MSLYIPCGPCGGAGQHLVGVVVYDESRGKHVSGGQRMVTCSFCEGTGNVSPEVARARRMAHAPEQRHPNNRG